MPTASDINRRLGKRNQKRLKNAQNAVRRAEWFLSHMVNGEPPYSDVDMTQCLRLLINDLEDSLSYANLVYRLREEGLR